MSKYLSHIRRLLEILSLRERIMLTAFVWMLLIIWMSSLLSQCATSRENIKTTGDELEFQDVLLSMEAETQALLEKTLESLDPTKTVNSDQLLAKVESIANEANLSFSISSPETQTGDIFTTHTLVLEARKAELRELIQFSQEIRKEKPYMGLLDFKLTALKRDPRKLNASFEISSFELASHRFEK